MKNDKIINDGVQPEIEKPTADGNPINNESILQQDTPSGEKLNERKPHLKGGRILSKIIYSILVPLSLILFILLVVPVLKELAPLQKTEIANTNDLKKDLNYKKQIGLLTKDIQRLSQKVNAYTSGQSYFVVNTTENRFYLYTNKKLVREGFCSSGSYTMLQTSGNKKWIFKTPKGKYWIRGKTTNPVWKRPDWSFVEEGSPIPSKDDFSRYEYGVLGDYALAIGDGYLIHGTIYKRFLGMPVTHGCVRLNDEDLKVIFNTLNIGSKVYIF